MHFIFLLVDFVYEVADVDRVLESLAPTDSAFARDHRILLARTVVVKLLNTFRILGTAWVVAVVWQS